MATGERGLRNVPCIMEYDGNMPRTQAEAEALKDTIRQMQTATTKNLK
jgi:hypothetical protein